MSNVNAPLSYRHSLSAVAARCLLSRAVDHASVTVLGCRNSSSDTKDSYDQDTPFHCMRNIFRLYEPNFAKGLIRFIHQTFSSSNVL